MIISGITSKESEDMNVFSAGYIEGEKQRKIDDIEDIFEHEEAERRRMFNVRKDGHLATVTMMAWSVLWVAMVLCNLQEEFESRNTYERIVRRAERPLLIYQEVRP